MTWGSELQVASPLKGSKLRERWLLASGESAAGEVDVEAKEPSDLALTKRSEGGTKLCRLPPRTFYNERKRIGIKSSQSVN